MKRQIIAELKQELHRMEVSSQPHEFEKHLYAMERLLGLLKGEAGNTAGLPVSGKADDAGSPSRLTEQDAAMLEMMGGRRDDEPKQNQPRNTGQVPAEPLDTDDGFGNGDSLFDF